MHKFLIERTLPGAGQLTPEALVGIAQTSNGVLRDLGPGIQWLQSYVTADKITCVYLAESVELIREHAKRGGFPCDKAEQVYAIIDPTTEDGALYSTVVSAATAAA
jgi:hypothetical protein